MEEGRNDFELLTDKPRVKRSLGRPRCTMDLKEMSVNTRNWVESTQDRDYWRALVNPPLKL